TTVTLNGPAAGLTRPVELCGDGIFVNQADILGSDDAAYDVSFGDNPRGSYFARSAPSFINQATITTGVAGYARNFSNSGTIGTATRTNTVYLNAPGTEAFAFSNSGTISGLGGSSSNGFATVNVFQGRPDDGDAISAAISNDGRIAGGLYASIQSSDFSFRNAGSIIHNDADFAAVSLFNYTLSAQTTTITNSGTIGAASPGGSALAVFAASQDDLAAAVTITNSGTIAARGGTITYSDGTVYRPLSPGLIFGGESDSTVSITNAATGTIAAPEQAGIALMVTGSALDLVNEGTISGGAGTVVAADAFTPVAGLYLTAPDGFFAGAIQTGDGADRISNSGTITGSIDLGAGGDVIENAGVIDGDVYLRSGNDRFVQRAGGTVTGLIDGGDGLDALVIDSTGDGAVAAMRYVDFESIMQTGSGNVTYSGAFAADTIGVDGGTATIAAGSSVSAAGPFTFTGGDSNETIVNDGIIAGGITLAGGDDAVVNRGMILGPVTLGDGTDSFTEAAGSTATGVDGGDGVDTYIADLAGDRSGLGSRTGFERLGITGTGTLSLTLDQDWDAISLAGTGLTLDPAGFTTARILGGDTSETVSVNGDTPFVTLGGGDDGLVLSGSRLTGNYSGGSGSDRLTLTATGPVTLAGTATGFETIALGSGALDVSGTLGAPADRMSLGDGAQVLTISSGGRLAGSVSLGGDADLFRLAAGAVLDGTVLGGEGNDRAILELTPDLAFNGDRLQEFEALEASGSGTLHLTGGTARFNTVALGDNGLTIDAGATLASGATSFGTGSSRVAVAGTLGGTVDLGGGDDVLRLTGSPGITGSVDGGSGNDRVELAVSGTDATPVALGSARLANFETLAVQSGVTSFAGNLDFGTTAITGGRLVGLAGSRLAAATITVASGATFGSAGTVTGNLAVAGTLSPGASPGTMTVNGNVALATGSTTVFELTPSISDQLIVSGAVTIASGATLSLTGARPLTPGVSLDLIVAAGGINGAYSTINQAATIGGFLSQSANRLQLLGTFRNDAAFTPQVRGTIDYVNGLLVSGQGGSALIAAVPTLLGQGGASNPDAFRRLSPESYAAASQLGTENGLTIIQAARAQSRTSPTTAGLFTFGQALTNQRTILGDRTQGTATGRLQTYGGIGGIGIGAEGGWIGAFVGYLDGRQRLRALDARTDAHGVIAGVQGELSFGGFSLGALAGYDGGNATTHRALPGGADASDRYGLHSWIGDLTARYTAMLGGWAVQPRIGLSYIRTTRGHVAESGTGPFLLDVARDRAERWFVDGDVAVIGGRGAGDRVHPYVSLGVRRSIDGRDSEATAAFRGASGTFTLPGLRRDRTVATAGAGIGLDLTNRLSLFGTYSGEFSDGVRHNGLFGIRLRM
ncbi:MAG: autotransporter domain-containing protein, partial [Rhizorhabdus sp.]